MAKRIGENLQTPQKKQRGGTTSTRVWNGNVGDTNIEDSTGNHYSGGVHYFLQVKKVLFIVNDNDHRCEHLMKAANSHVKPLVHVKPFVVRYHEWNMQDYFTALTDQIGTDELFDELIFFEHGDAHHCQFLEKVDPENGFPLHEMHKDPTVLHFLSEFCKYVKPDGAMIFEACCFNSAEAPHVLNSLAKQLHVKMLASTRTQCSGCHDLRCLHFAVDDASSFGAQSLGSTNNTIGKTVSASADDSWTSVGMHGSFFMKALQQGCHCLGHCVEAAANQVVEGISHALPQLRTLAADCGQDVSEALDRHDESIDTPKVSAPQTRILLFLWDNLPNPSQIHAARVGDVTTIWVKHNDWTGSDFVDELKKKFGNAKDFDADKLFDKVIFMDHGNSHHFKFLKKEDGKEDGIEIEKIHEHITFLWVMLNISKYMKRHAALILECCNFAQREAGQHALQFLSKKFKVTVAASTHLNGYSSKDGRFDWSLNYAASDGKMIDGKTLDITDCFDMGKLHEWRGNLGNESYSGGFFSLLLGGILNGCRVEVKPTTITNKITNDTKITNQTTINKSTDKA